MSRRGEEGVALLTMLLLVAAMSVLAVSVLDDMRFGIKRTENAETIGQAQWYALGAEALARARLAQLADLGPTRTADWNGRWLTFPIDEGMIQARLTDEGECFNLNSVVEGAHEQWRRRDLGLRQFEALLRELGVAENEAQALAEALADWIDSDSWRNTQGGEDDAYLSTARPYRTSGTLLSEVSELRAIKGFTADIYALVRPYVCALPSASLSPINVNTLSPEDALLLTMLTDGALRLAAARRIIEGRPAGGWRSVDEFWTSPAMSPYLPSDAALDQIAVITRFYGIEAKVDYAGGEVVMTSLFEQPSSGPAVLKARRWTRDE